jgi:amidase/aspartyl-tRNA(Asn)/glutamyl-tRNA(Gln) amidotransferase subunit A
VTPIPPLSLADWQALAQRDPAAAAHEVHRRVAALLSPAQQRACLAVVVGEEALATAFAGVRTGAPLAGVPYFLKDLFGLAGYPTRAGSSFLADVQPGPIGDAALVQALRAAGAVCAGKTHLHEFAYGITGENLHYGDCEHPHFPGRTTGGSSSGSAAVVAAGIVPFAIGTDTGGSVRTPAAFCGLYGFRLTPGHPWIADAFPLAPSCDTAGWLTRTAIDLLAVNSALLGLGTTRREPRGCYLEIGELDPAVAVACRQAAARLCAPADRATQGQLSDAFEGAALAYFVITSTEAARGHAAWLDTHREQYSPTVWQRLDRGRHWSVTESAAAEVRRRVIRHTLTSYFLTYDFLVLPATPCAALTKAECDQSHRERVLALSAPASLAGLPVLSAPVLLPSGLTTGLQVIVNSVQSPVIPWALKRL